ncbi:arginyltransferase [Hyphomicrobium facile]|uniref:Aspartate/glutamate leucyltransferase n=1 Tax=Hyphomicrobium facile TaxID=51670 RepID=A0A1I7NCN7_9HYPH|nr:arginyltransferase [Hyphomicrobium facile]SFV32323.1 arginine-tRNA-protein transferase [Hyphomicrobium facile]
MTEQQKKFPEFYVTAPQPCPYLPGRLERKLFTHLTHDKPPELVDRLLTTGFRRSQNIAYVPYCEGCQACISVRVLVNEFQPDRSMRRSWNRNSSLIAQRTAPTPTMEQFKLFRAYIDARHSDGGMADMTILDYRMMVEDTVIETFLTEYRQKPADATDLDFDSWPLKAVALCDRLTDGISMVYSFYDPADADAGLGTYMILEHIAFARRIGLPHVYLGYWIDGSRKMAYKTRFKPQERLGPDRWERVGDGEED